MTIEKLIKTHYSDLSALQKKLADYLLANIRDVSYLTSKEFAVCNGVSEPVVFRFCSKLGLDGYSELKNVIRDSIAEDMDLVSDDEEGSILKSVCEAAGKSLEKISAVYDDGKITEMANWIQSFENIYVMGYGPAYGIASEIFSLLSEARLNISFLRDALTDAPGYLKFGEKNLYIAVSFAPYRAYTQRYSSLAKKMGAKLITITDSPLNELAILADKNYVVEKVESGGQEVFITEGISALSKAVYCKYAELFPESIEQVQNGLAVITEILEKTL